MLVYECLFIWSLASYVGLIGRNSYRAVQE